MLRVGLICVVTKMEVYIYLNFLASINPIVLKPFLITITFYEKLRIEPLLSQPSEQQDFG